MTSTPAVTSAELLPMHRIFDGKVFIKSSSRLRLGQYITVEVFDTMDYDLLAEEVTDEPAE